MVYNNPWVRDRNDDQGLKHWFLRLGFSEAKPDMWPWSQEITKGETQEEAKKQDRWGKELSKDVCLEEGWCLSVIPLGGVSECEQHHGVVPHPQLCLYPNP